MKTTILILFTILILGSCSKIKERNEDVVKVEKNLNELIQDDNNGNLAGVMAHYAQNAILMAPNAPSIQGQINIENHYRALFEKSKFIGLRAIPNETRVQGDLAIIAGINTGIIQSKTDSTKNEINSKFIMQFIKLNGVWKISRLIWNDAGPKENISQPK